MVRMFEQIDEELKSVKEKMRMKNKYSRQLSSYQKERKEQQEKAQQLLETLNAEQEDVDKLTSKSLTNLMLTISGKKDDKLDKEKQEVAVAQLKYEEAKQTVEDMDKEINELHRRLGDVAGSENEYQNLLLEKEKLMKDDQSPLTPQLYELSEKKAELQALKTELNEAIQAGNRVKHILDKAEESLEKAAGWGTFDMLGGGMISTAVKHNHIDEAQDYIHQAQHQMRVFEKELRDVNEESEFGIDISGMLKFADFFFDGFISDFMVQGRINESLDQVKNQSSEVHQLIRSLQTTLQDTEKELTNLEQERKEIIEKSIKS